MQAKQAEQIAKQMLFREDVVLEGGGVFRVGIDLSFYAETDKLFRLLLISRKLTDADIVQREAEDKRFIEAVYGETDEERVKQLLQFQHQNMRDYVYTNAMMIAMCDKNFSAEYLNGAVIVRFAAHTKLETYPLLDDDPYDYTAENEKRLMDGMLPLQKGNLGNPVEQRFYQMAKLAKDSEIFNQSVRNRFAKMVDSLLAVALESYRNKRDGDFQSSGVGEFVANPTDTLSEKRKKRKNRKSVTGVSEHAEIPEPTQ